MRIKTAKARVVLNSRGEPTIEVEINGEVDSAPSGASRGSKEAKYIPAPEAARLFNLELSDFIKTFDIQTIDDLRTFEEEFFAIGGIEKYGANTLLATEYAILKAWSRYTGEPVFSFFNDKPKFDIKPLSNVIGGGIHARWKGPDIQEFLIIPDTKSFSEGVFINALAHKVLQDELSERDPGFLGSKNDEGAWVTTLSTKEILEIIDIVRHYIRDTEDVDILIGLDIAASQLYKDGKYIYRRDNMILDKEKQIEYILDLINEFNIYYIEDPLNEDDFEGFAEINKKTKSLIVGDDLTVTNPELLKLAIKKKAIKGIIIKPNQVGSLIKTMETVELAKKNGIIPILSHRSGETESNILSHLAVGLEVPIVKFGIVNGERITKLNELIRLEEKLKSL